MLSQSVPLVLLVLATCSGVVEGVGHRGSEFQVVFGPNIGASLHPILLVTTDEEGTVSFWVSYGTIAGGRTTRVVNNTYTVQKGGERRITLPTDLEISGSITSDPLKTITVKAFDDKLLTVVGVNEESASTDAFLALPKIVNKTGTYEYFVMSAESSNLEGSNLAQSFFGFITNEDNTTITINPKVLLRASIAPGKFLSGRETAATIPNKGFLFAGVSRTDLTGTRITSNKPLTLTSGHECTNLPINTSACEHMVEYFPPTHTWGFKFFLVPLRTRSADGYRIMTSKDSTQCQVTCNDKAGNPTHSETIDLQNAGDFKQFIYQNDHFCCVECNQPCLMVQYSLGSGYDDNLQSDPFMSMVPPVRQYSKDYETVFFESQSDDTQGVPVQFDAQMNLVVPVGCGPSGLRFDGKRIGVTFVDIIGSEGFIVARAAQFDPSVDTGVHKMTHTNPSCKFMLNVYGWGERNSYGFVAGLELDSTAATTYCLNESSLTVIEGEDVVQFTATRSGPVGQAGCIGVGVMNVTAQTNCCFVAGARKANCNITFSDPVSEPHDMLNISLIPREGQSVCAPTKLCAITFNSDQYSVAEDVQSGTVEVCLMVERNCIGDFSLELHTRDGTATAGGDYDGGPYIVTFALDENMACANITIIDDEIFEGDQNFIIDIVVPPRAPLTPMGRANVTIQDDDTDVICSVVENSVTVNQSEGNITVVIAISRKVETPFVCQIETQFISDEDGIKPMFAMVTFEPQEDTTQDLYLEIVNDTIGKPPEYLRLVVQDVNRQQEPVAINITIGDDDQVTTPSITGWCPDEEDSVWRIQWPATAPDSTQSVACHREGDTPGMSLAYRRCLAGGVWGSVNASECESAAFRAVRIKIEEFLKSLEGFSGTLTDGQRKAFQNIAQELNAALQASAGDEISILPQDLNTVAKFMEGVANLGENNGLFNEESNETQQVVADILSNVLDERNAPAFEATAQSSSADPEDGRTSPATNILHSTERVANIITSTLSKQGSFAVSRTNLVMIGQQFSFGSHLTAVVFPEPTATLPSFGKSEELPQIRLPRSFLLAAMGLKMASDNVTVEVVNVVMKNIENYLPSDVIKENEATDSEAEDTLLASCVLSSQILGYDGGEVDTNETVEVMFPINKRAQNLTVPSGMMKLFRCAFFNFTGGINRTGGWSYRGVETEVINDTHVRCSTSHLTSFVVLVSIVPVVGDPLPLDYITYVGCSISFLCLLACIIFFLSLRKELIQKLHNFVHLNLCIALSLGLLLFLTGIQTATANIYACKVVTALLHFFFLATFSWTLCEAVLIYVLLVKAFGANDRSWIYLYLVLGWGLPIPIVAITAGVSHDYYFIRSSFDQSHPHYENIKACWLPSEKGVIFAFIGPMATIIVVNAVLLIISLVSLAKSKCRVASKMFYKRDEKRQKYMKVGKLLLKATIILLPVLGFTWIIGLFVVGDGGIVFAYLFVIANVFQGLFIFLFHVLRHEKMYGKIKDKLPSSWKSLSLTNGHSSSSLGGTRSSKSTWMDSRRRGSFPTDSEPFARFEDHKLNAVVDSIKEGRDLDMKLNIIEEESEEQISSVYDQDEYITITTTAYGMTATITIEFGEEDLEEAAEGDESVKPEVDDEQEDKENEGF